MKRALPGLFLTLTLTAVAADEEGLASWYGEPYHGRVAASGEIYDMEEMTAAHRTLPFGTTVRVHRVDTGSNVVVRINDRGPIPEDRIIDLSRAAARRLGMIEPGVVPVILQVIEGPSTDSRVIYAVQIGAYRLRQNAERALAALRQTGTARVVFRTDTQLWSVLFGAAESRVAAESLARQVKGNPRLNAAFVVRVEATAGAIAE